MFIASVAALNAAFPLPAEDKKPDHFYTEEDKPFIKDEHLPYTQAKHYADQKVRSFIKDNPDIDRDIMEVPEDEIPGTKVQATFIAGEKVYGT